MLLATSLPANLTIGDDTAKWIPESAGRRGDYDRHV